MSYFETILEFAQDTHAICTTADAQMLGIPGIELVKLAQRGRLTREGHGVYRVSLLPLSDEYPYALALALVGHSACLYGESVLALLSLCPTSPRQIWVATDERVRRSLPSDVRVVQLKQTGGTTMYRGIRCQTITEAILSCRGLVMDERLDQAIHTAWARGFLTEDEAAMLQAELGGPR